MSKLNSITSTDLAGCVAGCGSNVKDDSRDFVQFLRKIAAERLTKNPNELSPETASAFIFGYENKIACARKNRVLEGRELSSLFKILEKELLQDKQAVFANSQLLTDWDIERANTLGKEAAECRRFAKELA